MAGPVSAPSSGKLLARLRAEVRARHYSPRTEVAYAQWIRRFVRFHGLRHPRELGEAEVGAFLSDLALRRGVSASTQNQALAAVLFLYRRVLRTPLPWIQDLVRAKRPVRLPIVTSGMGAVAVRNSRGLLARRPRRNSTGSR